jgi:hypothetical protein
MALVEDALIRTNREYAKFKDRSAFNELIKSAPKELQKTVMDLMDSVVFKNYLYDYIVTDESVNEYVSETVLPATSHTVFTDIGTNTHPQIDTHIADDTIHYVRSPVVEKTSNYTVAATEEMVACDATSGAIKVTLPTAVGKEGFVYIVKKTDSSANAVRVSADGAETIDGASDVYLYLQHEVIAVKSNGTNWWII